MKDNKLQKLIREETIRQNTTIDLIASENIASNDVMEALGSPLTNKYSEGYPGKRYYAGNAVIDKIELLAQERAKKAFGLGDGWAVNVQPYSGSPANFAVYSGLLKPNEKICGMSLPFGGHLTHGAKVNFSGKFYESVQYGTDEKGLLDYDAIAKLAKREKPAILVCGATAYPRKIDFKRFAEIARDVHAYLFADISHIAGLIAAKSHPSPFGCADIVTTTTHKSLRGPRGAMIFINRNSKIAKERGINIEEAINKAVFPGAQGGPHNNQTAAIAACLREASLPAFKKYGEQIVINSKALANGLKKHGFKLVSGGSDNHLILIDLTNTEFSGREAQELLEKAGIITNRNAIPNDPRKPFDPSGLRIGTPSTTTRGMKEKEMDLIADFLHRILFAKGNPQTINKEVKRLCIKFPAFRSPKRS